MTIAYWCVLAAIVLPYIFSLIAKSSGRYNNYSPREFLEKQEGYHKRAHWVQLNSYEAFPAFAAAVIIAHLCLVSQSTIDTLAVGFIGARVLYGVAYLANKATLRSLVWGSGFACVIALFVFSALV